MTDLVPVERKGQTESPITCFRCGVCCTEYQVHLSLIEGQRIADRLELTWEEFLTKYVDKRWPGTKTFLIRKHNGACIFLNQINGSKIKQCRIHAFRPSSCIEWIPSLHRKECLRGLANYWGLPIDPSGYLVGSTQNIRKFCDLLKSFAT